MRPADVLYSISELADAVRRQGHPPRYMEVGRMQDAALQAGGIIGDTLDVQVSEGEDPAFRPLGGPFPSSGAVRVTLHINRVKQDDWLQVTAS